jgi:hypothetical protein
LDKLSIELFSEYIHDTLVPLLVKQRYDVAEKAAEYDNAVLTLYREHGLRKICPSAVYSWLKVLHFKYEPRKKGYFVDGHEKEERIMYRNKYVKQYLKKERQTFRWLQLTADESKDVVRRSKVN